MHTWDDAAAQFRAENGHRTKKWQYDEALFLRWLATQLNDARAEFGAMRVADGEHGQ